MTPAREGSWLNGRGKCDTHGKEPDYYGVIGYAVVSEDQRLEKRSTFTETPWTIPVYQQDKQFWQESGTITHKTKVVVVDQELERNGDYYYKGYLHVIRMDTKEACYLNVKNFVTSSYWEKTLTEIAGTGYSIAEFRQVSDYYPVSGGGDKVALEDGFQVLIPGRSYSKGPDKDNNPIPAYVFKEWKYGFGEVLVYFNSEDLKLVY